MKTTAHEYHRQRRGNCAQSVAFAWASKNPGAENQVEAYAGCGAGRAPGGLCGALHASCELAGDGAAEDIRRGFAEKTGGHLMCKDIRAARALPCSECVAIAAELLEQHAGKGDASGKR